MSSYDFERDDDGMADVVDPSLMYQSSPVKQLGYGKRTHSVPADSSDSPAYKDIKSTCDQDYSDGDESSSAVSGVNNNSSDPHRLQQTQLVNSSSDSYAQRYPALPHDANWRTNNIAGHDVFSSANSHLNLYDYGSFMLQNNSFGALQPHLQYWAHLNNMILSQAMFMPAYPYNMMQVGFGHDFLMYGQPVLPIMEPVVQTMGPPSTIVSTVETWRNRVSSPAESTTTAANVRQNALVQTGSDTSVANIGNPAMGSSFANPAQSTTYNTVQASPTDHQTSMDVKPELPRRKAKNEEASRGCFVCAVADDDETIECAHPHHKGAAKFHVECAGFSGVPDNVAKWVCNTCLNADHLQSINRSIASPSSSQPETDHCSYHPSPKKKKTLQRRGRRNYNVPFGVDPLGALFTPYSSSTPYQPSASASRRNVPLTQPIESSVTGSTTNPSGRGQSSHGGWSTAEDEACISVMSTLIKQRANELRIPIDKMWDLASGRMARCGFHRSASGIKMQWTRRLRAMCGLDERKVPNANMMRTGLIPKKGDKKKACDTDSDEEDTMARSKRASTTATKRGNTNTAMKGAGRGRTIPSSGKTAVSTGRVTKRKNASGSASRARRGNKVAKPKSTASPIEDIDRVDEGVAMYVDKPVIVPTMVRDDDVESTVDEHEHELRNASLTSSNFEDALEDTLMD